MDDIESVSKRNARGVAVIGRREVMGSSHDQYRQRVAIIVPRNGLGGRKVTPSIVIVYLYEISPNPSLIQARKC